MPLKIFILEDDQMRMVWFRDAFKSHDIDHAESCLHINRFIPPYNVVFLDHDLGGRQLEDHEDDGEAFAKLIVDRLGDAFVIIHSFNPVGAQDIWRITGGFTAPFRGNFFMDLVTQLNRGIRP